VSALPPPQAGFSGWSQPAPPRPRATILGIERSLWLLAWLPLWVLMGAAVWMPAFVAPLFDDRVGLLGFAPAAWFMVLPAVNLVAGLGGRLPGMASVILTTAVAAIGVFLGPAAVLVLINSAG
jgi:hypothetical protein